MLNPLSGPKCDYVVGAESVVLRRPTVVDRIFLHRGCFDEGFLLLELGVGLAGAGAAQKVPRRTGVGRVGGSIDTFILMSDFMSANTRLRVH